MRRWLAAAAWLLLAPGPIARAARPPPVDVARCCGAGEELDAGGACGPRPAGTASAPWAPLVYAPQRQAYLPRGRPPPHWRVLPARRPPCPAPRLLRAGPAHAFLLFANGSLWLRERARLVPPALYCADPEAALVCESDAPGGPGEPPPAQALRKCCGEGYAYSAARATCAPGPAESSGVRLAALLAGAGESEGAEATRPVSGFPACENGTYALAGSPSGARLLANGSLALGGGGAPLPADEYCAEWYLERAGEAAVLACPGLVAAASDARSRPRDLRFTLYPAGLLVSALFLAATLAAGLALPSGSRTLQWRCQTRYVAALLLGDVLLAATQLADPDRVPFSTCVAMAVMMHFLFLSAFFWLNTMCFNIWWTFRDFRPTSMEKSQEWCRLRVYEVYAWGGPFLIALVAVVLDRLPQEPSYTFLRPRFGEQRCWFYGDTEILTFFFGPVGVLLCVNLALFISTARQLTCGLWRRDEVKSTTERVELRRVCAKLVVVMGVTWVADVVSWGAGGPQEVWYITDLINALQGVFIFIVVCCQPKVWAAVKRAWCVRRLRGERGSRGAAAAPLHSSSQMPSCGDSVTHNTLANTNISNASNNLPRETVC